jgi:peptide deformylase
MTHRPFVIWPHPALRRPATPVAEITDDVRAIWDEMIVAMDMMPGLGLAAPQLGIDLALAVVDASEARGQAIRMANPTVLHSSVEPRVQEFVGLWATSVQHQIDHLAGKMFFDHLTRVKRDMLIKKAAKVRRG